MLYNILVPWLSLPILILLLLFSANIELVHRILASVFHVVAMRSACIVKFLLFHKLYSCRIYFVSTRKAVTMVALVVLIVLVMLVVSVPVLSAACVLLSTGKGVLVVLVMLVVLVAGGGAGGATWLLVVLTCVSPYHHLNR